MQTSSSQATKPSHDQIAQIAQSLWQQAGQPQNRDLEFWLTAEQRVNGAPAGGQRAKASLEDVLNSAASKQPRRDRKAG